MLEVGDVRHRVIPRLTLAQIPGADLDRVKSVQNIDLGERDRVDAVGGHRIASHGRVEPADAPRSPRGRPVLMADLADGVARGAGELGRERPVADARRVRLEHAHRLCDARWGDAAPRAGAAGGRRR